MLSFHTSFWLLCSARIFWFVYSTRFRLKFCLVPNICSPEPFSVFMFTLRSLSTVFFHLFSPSVRSVEHFTILFCVSMCVISSSAFLICSSYSLSHCSFTFLFCSRMPFCPVLFSHLSFQFLFQYFGFRLRRRVRSYSQSVFLIFWFISTRRSVLAVFFYFCFLDHLNFVRFFKNHSLCVPICNDLYTPFNYISELYCFLFVIIMFRLISRSVSRMCRSHWLVVNELFNFVPSSSVCSGDRLDISFCRVIPFRV